MAADGERKASSEDDRKMFVGGLPASADEEKVRNYFSKYGDVEMCTIKTDVQTGRSRGFGFLLFARQEDFQKAVSEQGHEIDGKKVEAKLATPQGSRQNGMEDPETSTKVFVGGIDKSLTSDDIKTVFNERGNVLDVFLPTDKMSGESKGFAFVNFDNSSIAQTLCAEGKITIHGKECDIKKANSKSDSRSRGGMRGGRGGRGGFGGRGGWGGGYDQYGSGGYGGGYGGGYDQYGGYGGGYQGGYGGPGGGYGSGGGGYGGGYNSGGYDQNSGYSQY